MNRKFIYNNEAICGLAIVCILRHNKSLSISKVALIAPIVFNNNLMSVFSGKTKVDSLEELLAKRGKEIIKTRDLFFNFLPLTLNSIVLLKEMKIININNGEISLISSHQIDNWIKKSGKRAKRIEKSSYKISNILKEADEKLYIQMRVEL